MPDQALRDKTYIILGFLILVVLAIGIFYLIVSSLSRNSSPPELQPTVTSEVEETGTATPYLPTAVPDAEGSAL